MNERDIEIRKAAVQISSTIGMSSEERASRQLLDLSVLAYRLEKISLGKLVETCRLIGLERDDVLKILDKQNLLDPVGVDLPGGV